MASRKPQFIALGLAMTLAACGSRDDPNRLSQPAPDTTGGTQAPSTNGGGLAGDSFEPIAPSSYVPKVKTVLTGLPATDEEIQAVIKDPGALRGLIDQWMALQEFSDRMVDFYRNAFQQNRIDLYQVQDALSAQFEFDEGLEPKMTRNLRDSFAMTVGELVKEGRPFTETITTNRYMLTPALMSLMSYLDDMNVGDGFMQLRSRLVSSNAVPQYTVDIAAVNAIPRSETLDPASPNYLRFPLPVSLPGCTTTTATRTATDAAYYRNLFGLFMGKYFFNPCPSSGLPTKFRVPQVFDDADYTTWRMVTLHVDTAAASAAPSFFELPKLRTTQDLTLQTQRMGFFGTLAFDANWPTNLANEGRVTANQALIVALGLSIADEDTIQNFPVNARDRDHSADPDCAGCHSQLDPYKQFFRRSYSLHYGRQQDSAVLKVPPTFAIAGVMAGGDGVADLANVFTSHPRFALAWALKLHSWANSTQALESDPEIARVADAFRASNFDFKTLVRELFSSPLVTYASATATTTANGIVTSIARRDQFCSSISVRLGLSDVCRTTDIATKASLMPVDSYYRSNAFPSFSTDPDLFYRQTVEYICNAVSEMVVDAPGKSRYTGSAPDAAMDDFVAQVMGLAPSDPRAAPARRILAANYEDSIGGGADRSAALKATFTLACIAPSSVGIGL